MLTFVQAAVVVYLGYLTLLFALQRRLLFPGVVRESGRSLSSPAPPGVERHWLELSDGGAVEAWYFRSHEGRGAEQPAIIFAHGNAELIDDWTILGELTRLGVGVLLIEFPGFGLSTGKASRARIAEAFRAGYDRLVEHPDVDPDRVVVMGRSIGGGVASDLATERPVRALILQSTFSSLSRIAWRRFGAPGFFLSDAYDNVKAVRSFDGPVLLMHGRSDRLVPFSHARTLARERPDAELIEWDCGHNDCPPDWDGFIEDVRDFLVRHSVIAGEASERSPPRAPGSDPESADAR